MSRQHTIEIPADHTIVLQKHRKNDFGLFQALSPFRTRDNTEMDIFDLLAQVSPKAFRIFNEVKLDRDPETNICIIAMPYDTPSQKASFSRAFNELKRAEILKKVKAKYLKPQNEKMVLIFNPHLIKCFDIKKAQEIWFNC